MDRGRVCVIKEMPGETDLHCYINHVLDTKVGYSVTLIRD